jgi:hypothetical protein
MKTITVPPQAVEVNAILSQALDEDVLVRTADGGEFMLTAIDDFDEEIVRTRRSDKLMALLDQRARQSETIPLDDVKRQLGFID